MEGNRNCSDTAIQNQTNKIRTTIHLQIADLPEEAIHNILIRLPVKSLLKSKCVSKSWLSLISSPQFVKEHLKFSSRNANFTNHRIMLTFTDQCSNLKQCSISSLMSEGSIVASDIGYPNNDPHVDVSVVGSCNGLICLAIDEKDIFLWNPSTRKSKAVPCVDIPTNLGSYYTWGFGYSESEDDYKVVCIFCDGWINDRVPESTIKIYSLRTDSWKTIGDFSCGIPYQVYGRFAGGKLHFSAAEFHSESRSRSDIVSFDLKTEAYGIVEQPDYGVRYSTSYFGLIGGCLGVRCQNEGKHMDLWVMKEYGVKESWMKVVSIPYIDDDDPDCFLYSNPLLIMPNSELLWFFKGSLVVYNVKNNRFRYLISNLENLEGDNIYVESLVAV